MRLVIVDSPEAASALNRLLDPGYQVRVMPASPRLLALEALKVSPGGEIAEQYQMDPAQTLALAALRRAAREATRIFLATPPDRAGELLAWDLLECLPRAERGKVRRMRIDAYRRDAVRRALEEAGELQSPLLDAARSRRLLHTIFAREVAPLLRKWGLLEADAPGPDLVEIAALQLLAEAEALRREADLRPRWEIEAQLACEGRPFLARLCGEEVRSEAQAFALVEQLVAPETGWWVERLAREEEVDDAPLPFDTAGLLLSAERALRLPPGQSLAAAFALYHRGLISFPLTGSAWLPAQELDAAAALAGKLLGEGCLAAQPLNLPRRRAGESAIRPLDPGRLPEEIGAAEFGPDEAALYSLIWRRLLASRLRPCRDEVLDLSIRLHWSGSLDAGGEPQTIAQPLRFEAALRSAVEEGFRLLEPDEEEEGPAPLPGIEVGDSLDFVQVQAWLRPADVLPAYSEARLASELALRGIGSPAEGAAVSQRLREKGWARLEDGELRASPRGEDALFLCESSYREACDLDAIAGVERQFEAVARGEVPRSGVFAQFFFSRIAPARAAAREALEQSGEPRRPLKRRQESA